MTTQTKQSHLTIELSPDEANAVVCAVSYALLNEGDELAHLPVPSCPGELSRIAEHAGRIAALAGVADALSWRAHWGSIGGTPEPVTTAQETWLDLLAELRKRAEEQASYESEDERREYDAAGRTIARAYAEAA